MPPRNRLAKPLQIALKYTPISAMFIDEARIRIKAGDGGNGCMAFRREKFVPRGGPSGGDGGHGGDIIMESSLSHNTLVHFRFNPEHKSERGGHGLGSNCSGISGEAHRPQGSRRHHPLRRRRPASRFTTSPAPTSRSSSPAAAAAAAATSTSPPAPTRRRASTNSAAPAKNAVYRLELRLLADAGLVGYPNVGKSTLISRISAARPKVADYAFTTLEPNLGVVSVGDWPHEESFTIADLPGLIEGAHLGAGLGIQFLRHIERTSVIVHLVDVSDGSGREDPVEDFKIITAELKSFDPALAAKPTILVAAKADVANPDKLKKLRAMAKRRKLAFYEISAVTGEGIEPLKYAIAELVTTHRGVVVAPPVVLPKKRKPAYPPLASSAKGRAH